MKSLLYKPWYFHPYYISILVVCLYLVAYFKSPCSHPHSLFDMLLELFLPPSGVIEIGVLGSLPFL